MLCHLQRIRSHICCVAILSFGRRNAHAKDLVMFTSFGHATKQWTWHRKHCVSNVKCSLFYSRRHKFDFLLECEMWMWHCVDNKVGSRRKRGFDLQKRANVLLCFRGGWRTWGRRVLLKYQKSVRQDRIAISLELKIDRKGKIYVGFFGGVRHNFWKLHFMTSVQNFASPKVPFFKGSYNYSRITSIKCVFGS